MTREEFFEKWIAFLKTNPRKCRFRLEDADERDRRCCLGHACFLSGISREVRNDLVFYEDKSSSLPLSLADILKIDICGAFNQKGIALVRIYLRENFIKIYEPLDSNDLMSLNDFTNMTHAQIGEVIEMLYKNDGFLPNL